jgi:hypothetical protein
VAKKRARQKSVKCKERQAKRGKRALDEWASSRILGGAVTAGTFQVLRAIVGAQSASDYLDLYIRKYSEEYSRWVAKPPEGRGYPNLSISPYLYSKALKCEIALNGFIVWDGWDSSPTDEPYLVHPPNSRDEPEILAQARRPAPVQPVDNANAPNHIRLGEFPAPTSSVTRLLPIGTLIRVSQYEIDFDELLARIFFGAADLVNFSRCDSETEAGAFWIPRLITNAAVHSLAGHTVRYFHYLEISRHVELVPIHQDTRPRQGGQLKGQIKITDDFDAEDPQIQRLFSGDGAL